MSFSELNQSENSTIEQLVDGNEQAFSVLFEEYSPQVYYIGLKYLKSQDLANDVVQDTFLKLWNYRSHIDASQAIKPLIVTFAKRIILNLIRDEKRKIVKHLEIYTMSSNSSNKTEEQIIFNETNQVYQEAVKSLPERRREVFLLKSAQGKSNEEVAEELGLSVNTVKSQYTKALQAIRAFVSNYYSVLAIAVAAAERL
ncbi:RNA polymerase sigma-70 factor [Echinicola strongylocentroti]|uniref:RNA polymerase sigma-70 factor n=1 Tax=Echinicola strongylocentroti TaxID=1795355 RepID=A0A2Z4INF5_9BACT|nr:RNA polymerase sigma-70 factor [Echinicola strongylocentroti]AWW32260.1 RNA polymerase sigma-70 factor [Echinicola strongylocentroti]